MNKEKKYRLEVTQLEFAQLIQEAENSPINSTIRKVLNRKIDDMVKREYYSDMIEAPTEQEREEARQAYLDKIGVPIKYRW